MAPRMSVCLARWRFAANWSIWVANASFCALALEGRTSRGDPAFDVRLLVATRVDADDERLSPGWSWGRMPPLDDVHHLRLLSA